MMEGHLDSALAVEGIDLALAAGLLVIIRPAATNSSALKRITTLRTLPG